MIRPRTIALLYVLFAALATLLLASMMPPFQNADEANHTYRADQISHFGLFGAKLADGEIGGDVDAGLKTETAETATLPFHRDAKVSRTMFAPLAWGAPEPTPFPNTAIYPPFFYLPAAVMAAAARHAGITLPHGLVLMRLAMAASTIAIGAAAIALAGNAAIWLFAILLLPMSLALTAAVTQDGPMLACTALAVALCLRLRNPSMRWRRGAFVLMCVLLALAGMARPPYAAFALLVLTVPIRPKWRLVALGGIVICAVAWGVLNLPHVVLPHRPEGAVDPGAQLLSVALHPWRLLDLAAATWRATGIVLRESFIGFLGWMDVELPAGYYKLAAGGLAVAAAAAWCAGTGWPRIRMAGLAALAALGASAGVVIIQYMTWNAVGVTVIDGLQGRYFLPPALVLGIVLARPFVSVAPARTLLSAPVLALPVISIAVTVHAVLVRYYF